MRSWRWFVALLWVMWALTGTSSADVAFPARLDVTEHELGVYGVSFTLPIVEGRKLRAEPRMPPTCVEVSPRETGVSSGGYTSTWSVRCDPAALAGEAILVEGLLGTQTDLAFTLTMLDGRTYSRILRPSRPGFLVPEPPSRISLARETIAAGVRRTLRFPSLWFLVVVAALSGLRARILLMAVGAFAVGHFAAQWLGGRGWLEISPQMRDALTWATIAIPATRLAGAGDGWRGWLRPLWPTTFLLGLLFGAARPEALAPEGLSNAEQVLALVLFTCGVSIAVVLMVAVACELRAVLALVGGGGWRQVALRVSGYVIGGLAVGMLLAQLVGLVLSAGADPRSPLELFVLAVLLGPTAVHAGRRDLPVVLLFGGLAAFGATMGLVGVVLPISGLLTLGSLLVLGAALAANRPLSIRWAAAATVIALPAHVWSTANELVDNVSRSTAMTTGTVLVAAFLFYVSLVVARDASSGDLPIPVRFMGAGAAVLAVVWRLGEYRVWFEREVATEAALGLARLPLLAAVLLVLAVVLWIRRRRMVGEHIGAQQPLGLHWYGIAAAFLLLPFGTVAVQNPFFSSFAPRGDGARLIMSRVLSDTYQALNIEDESELYDALGESVTGNLVDDLYLDNRRRLTSGMRAGTEITIRGVNILEIGEPVEGPTGDEGFAYDCRWAVVARVQHLQHVHHRRNIFNGVLTLQADEGRWKIAGVELHSEEREVVPWEPT